MLIPYNLKLRLERYKQDKIEATKLEQELSTFQNLPQQEKEREIETIEVKQYKTYRSIARTTKTIAQQMKQKEYDKRYREKKREIRRKAKKMGLHFTDYPARNPVKIMKIKIKGEDF